MLNLFKKKVIKEEKGLKLSKVGTRPKDDEIEKTLKLKELPKYFREVDPYLVSEINDILHGEDGIEYERVLRELNTKYRKRDSKTGNQLYDANKISEMHKDNDINVTTIYSKN